MLLALNTKLHLVISGTIQTKKAIIRMYKATYLYLYARINYLIAAICVPGPVNGGILLAYAT